MYECRQLESSHACITECYDLLLFVLVFLSPVCSGIACSFFVTLLISLIPPDTRKVTLEEECTMSLGCVNVSSD